jgi:outer membrane protein assembly factor BamB
MFRTSNFLTSFLCTSILFCSTVVAQVNSSDSHQFRGTDGTGVVGELGFPESWGAGSNIAWSADLKGGGLSSPVVVGDRIFLTTAVGFAEPASFMQGVSDMRPKLPEGELKFQVMCLKLSDGSLIWEKTVAEQKPQHPIHASNSFATETPASDGTHLFVYYGSIGKLAGMDLDGNVLWEKDLGAFPTGNGFGSGSSITVGDGKVYVQCDNDQSSFVAAFESATGDEVWNKPRDGRTSWSTPVFWRNDIRSELVTCGSGTVTSYNPKNGEELWSLSNIGMSFSASPAVDSKQIYFGNSGPRSSGPLVAIPAGINGKHELSANGAFDKMAWSKMQAGPGMSSPVSVDGKVYVAGRSKLVCYAAETGEEIFKARLPLGSMAASLWAAGNRVFAMDETGKAIAIEIGAEMKVSSTNQIKDDLFWSTPAMAGNSLLIRGNKKLYCIRK